MILSLLYICVTLFNKKSLKGFHAQGGAGLSGLFCAVQDVGEEKMGQPGMLLMWPRGNREHTTGTSLYFRSLEVQYFIFLL